MLHLIEKGTKDDIFNVGFEQTLTLQEFIHALSTELGTEVQYASTDPESFNLFPSVTRGGVDVTKIKETGFVPTPFNEAIHVNYIRFKCFGLI